MHIQVLLTLQSKSGNATEETQIRHMIESVTVSQSVNEDAGTAMVALIVVSAAIGLLVAVFGVFMVKKKCTTEDDDDKKLRGKYGTPQHVMAASRSVTAPSPSGSHGGQMSYPMAATPEEPAVRV